LTFIKKGSRLPWPAVPRLALHRVTADPVPKMVVRQSLWSFEPSLRDEIAREVSRKATRRQLGPKFHSVVIARHDDGPVLNFLFLGSDRHSARWDSWMLIRNIAADVYARTPVRSW